MAFIIRYNKVDFSILDGDEVPQERCWQPYEINKTNNAFTSSAPQS